MASYSVGCIRDRTHTQYAVTIAINTIATKIPIVVTAIAMRRVVQYLSFSGAVVSNHD